MLVYEVAAPQLDMSKLLALADFLTKRAGEVGAKKQISGQAFINLAQSLGVPLTISQLKDLVQRPPLDNIIDNIQGSDTEPEKVQIIFKAGTADPTAMTVDQARNTVDSMAKRAIDIK